MGIVKYTGPVASFHCPTNVEIRSLKVHFSPKQLGEGDPSPENVREIVGWDGVEAYKTSKNLIDIDNDSYSCPFSNGVSGGTIPSDFKFEDGEFSGTVQQGTRDLSVFTSNRAYPPGTYTLSYDYENNAINSNWRPVLIAVGNKSNNWYSSATNCAYNGLSGKGHFTKTFTAVTPVYFNLSLNNYGNAETTAKNRIYNIKLELGSTATSYEPYRGSITDYEFGVLGKNKFDKSQCIDDCRIGKTDGRNYGDAGYYISPFIPVSVGASYTKNSPNVDAYHRFATYSEANTDSFIRILDNSNTIIIEEGEKYLRFCGEATEKDTAQLELGSTATEYEPYDPNKTVYGGWVDLITGEVCEERKSIALESLDWNGSSNRARASNSIDLEVPSYTVAPDFIAEKYYAASYSTNLTNYPSAIALGSSGFIAYYDGETLPSGKMVYKLSEPNYYNLPPHSTELKTFLGHNNVWSNADYVEVEYDLHETQDILARKQFIVANQPHIVSPAAAPLQNFVTDMAAPLKECKIGFEPVQDLHSYDKPWVGGSGKNLFNINAPMQNPSDTTLSNTTKRIFTPNTYSVGASYSNWWQPNKITDYSISNSSITVTSSTGYGVCFAIKAKPETYYTVSATVVGGNPRINNAYYDSEGNYLGSASTGGNITTFQTPENTDIMVIIFAPVNNTEATFSNIQVEEGQTATAYEPWENVCPISGWENIEINQSGKNLNNNWLKPEGITASGYYNGYSSWAKDWAVPASLIGVTLRYSAFIDNTGTTDTRDAYLHIWTKDINGTYIRTNVTSTTHLNPGESGRLVASITPRDTEAFISCGLTMPAGCKASEPLLEIGSIETDYEPYRGTTIPITSPATTNLLTKTTLTTNKTLDSNGGIISETGMTVTDFIKVNEGETYKLIFTSKEGARTRRIYSYDSNKDPIESLASASWVTVDTIGTIQATIPSGAEYIRVCYKTADENIFLEGPESFTIYGGYVDLINGEIVAEYSSLDLSTITDWISWGDGNYRSNKITNMKNINWTAYPDSSLFAEQYKIVRPYDIQYKGATGIGGYQNTICSSVENPTGIIVYKLAEPIRHLIDPITLKTIRGTNNIWSNTNGNIELKYWTH